LQAGIRDGEDVTGLRLLVHENALLIAFELFLHFEDAFAFEHHGQDVGRGGVLRIVRLHDFSQERFGVLLLNRLRRRGRRRFINALPVGDESLAIGRSFTMLLLPASLAQVAPLNLMLQVEQGGVIMLPVGKVLLAGLAGVRAQLNVPFVHESTPGRRATEIIMVMTVRRARGK
jgi:hypothetical protein